VNWRQWCFDGGQVEREMTKRDERGEKGCEGMNLHARDHVLVQKLISNSMCVCVCV